MEHMCSLLCLYILPVMKSKLALSSSVYPGGWKVISKIYKHKHICSLYMNINLLLNRFHKDLYCKAVQKYCK